MNTNMTLLEAIKALAETIFRELKRREELVTRGEKLTVESCQPTKKLLTQLNNSIEDLCVDKPAKLTAKKLVCYVRDEETIHPRLAALELRRAMKALLRGAKQSQWAHLPIPPAATQPAACQEKVSCRDSGSAASCTETNHCGAVAKPESGNTANCSSTTRPAARGLRRRRRGLRLKRFVLYYQRQQQSCYWCGRAFENPDQATADHLMPRSRGGTDKLDNLVLACAKCNAQRKDNVAHVVEKT